LLQFFYSFDLDKVVPPDHLVRRSTVCFPNEDVRDRVHALANTEAFQQSRRERKKVEMRFAHVKRLLICVGNCAKSDCGAAVSCYEIGLGSPEIAKFPVKFPDSREFAWRRVRSALGRQPGILVLREFSSSDEKGLPTGAFLIANCL
jgi:hypothetical protein